jgi:hypothetical protein
LNFARDHDERPIERATAIRACRIILSDVVGAQAAAGAKIEFQNDPVTVADVLRFLEETTDSSRGWQCLLKRAGFKVDA